MEFVASAKDHVDVGNVPVWFSVIVLLDESLPSPAMKIDAAVPLAIDPVAGADVIPVLAKFDVSSGADFEQPVSS